jgi:hypothetical protein
MGKIDKKVPIEYLDYLVKLWDNNYNTGYISFENRQFPEKLFLKIDGEYIYVSEKEKLSGEEFFEHDYLPVFVSNYGRIKSKKNGEPIKQKVYFGKNGSPYFYVKLEFNIPELIKETFSENMRNDIEFTSPIVIDKIESYSEFDKSDILGNHHPYIRIVVNKNGSIIWENEYAKKDKDMFIKFKEQNDRDSPYINIPFHVYRLVAETWLKNEDRKYYTVVHHKINNGFDNTIYNLIWMEYYEHKKLHIYYREGACLKNCVNSH